MNISGKSVYLLGDSHSGALAPRLQRLFTEGGVSSFGARHQNGWATSDYLRRGNLERSLPDADIYIIQLGGNDASKGIVGPQLEDRVRSLLAIIPPGKKVFWIGPSVTRRSDLQAPAGRHSRPEASRRIKSAVGSRATFIDGARLVSPANLRSDGVHYNSSGYTEFANNIYKEVSGTSTWWMPMLFATAFGIVYWLRSRRKS